MTLRSVIKVTEKYVIDNSPTLLAALAATGAMTTAYLTGKATFRAADIITESQIALDMQELEAGRQLTTKEKMKLVWKEYLPPALVLSGTVACIVLSNSISSSRLAALAAAYKISEKQFAEYKDKVLEKFGENKANEVRSELTKDRLNRAPFPTDGLEDYPSLGPGGARTWCFDSYTGRYFKSDMQTIRSIENDINKQLIDDTYVRLTDFYARLGLESTKLSGELGWTLDSPMDLKFDSHIADGSGGVPVLVIDFGNRLPVSLREYRYFPGCENPY